MRAGERRRLYVRAGILMVTRGMDPTQAILEAARQLGFVGAERTNQALGPKAVDSGDERERH